MPSVTLDLRCLKEKTVKMEPLKGTSLFECKRDAALVALLREVDVEFTFNGVTYITGHQVLISCVTELK